MKATMIVTAALLFGACTVCAQPYQQTSDRAAAATKESRPRPTIGMGSKTMESCTVDKQRVCADATDYMTKECLVKNWDHISSDCQDALGTPFDGAAGHG